MTYYSEKDVIIGYSNENQGINNFSTIQEQMPEDVLFRIETTCQKLENTISDTKYNDVGELEDFEVFLNQ